MHEHLKELWREKFRQRRKKETKDAGSSSRNTVQVSRKPEIEEASWDSPKPKPGVKDASQESSEPVVKSDTGHTEVADETSQQSAADLSAELWNQAYDQLKTGSATTELVEAYETVLAGFLDNEKSEQTAVQSSAATGADNPLLRCSGSDRIAVMAQVTDRALARAKKHDTVHQTVNDTVTFIKDVQDTVSGILSAYPPAALALSGVCVVLPILARPSTERLEMRAGLEYVMEKLEWYMALARVALRESWQSDSEAVQLLDVTKNKVVGLYAALLEYEMKSVCACFRTGRLVGALRAILSLDDWANRLEEVKRQEADINGTIGQYVVAKSADALAGIGQDTSNLAIMLQELRAIRAAQEATRTEQLNIRRSNCIAKLSTETTCKYDVRRNIVPDRLKGTCEWFVKHEHFRHWLESADSSLLLVTADAGCGKSVLSRYLVETVLPASLPESTVVTYFFFNDPAEVSFARAMCAIVHQLLCSRHELVDQVEQQIAHAGTGLVENWSRLWAIFETCVFSETAPKVVCVIDALDECTLDASTLVSCFQKLMTSLCEAKQSTLKVLVTTRGYPEITNLFSMSRDCIRLAGENDTEVAQIQREIAIVTNYKVDQLAQKKNLSRERADELRDQLVAKGGEQRTYLWVHLIFEVLEVNYRNTKTVWTRLINTLPESVYEAYEELLGAMSKHNRSRVKALFHLMFSAFHPLSLTTAATLLDAREQYVALSSLPVEGIDMLEVESEDSFRSWIMSTCHCFVRVYQDCLYFIHLTAREFLQKVAKGDAGDQPAPEPNLFQHSISEQEAHRFIAESCLACGAFITCHIHDEYYFLNYWETCCENHFRFSQVYKKVDGRITFQDVDPQFWPAYETRIARMRLSSKNRAEALDSLHSRLISNEAVFMASLGHYRLLSHELDQVDPGRKDRVLGRQCIEAALRSSCLECVQFLIDTGYELDFSSSGHLILAIYLGKLETVSFILDHNAKKRCEGSWPTSIVNLPDDEGVPPLYHAIYTRLPGMAKLLVDYGADPNQMIRLKSGESCLLASFCSFFFQGGLLQMLDLGASVHAVNTVTGRTILHEVVTFDYEGVKILLDSGARVDDRDNDGCTPLHYVCAWAKAKGVEIAKLLLDHGAAFDARNKAGRTPFFIACSLGRSSMAEFFIEAGVGTSLVGKGEQTPLDVVSFLAATNEDPDLVQHLQNKRIGTLIHEARWQPKMGELRPEMSRYDSETDREHYFEAAGIPIRSARKLVRILEAWRVDNKNNSKFRWRPAKEKLGRYRLISKRHNSVMSC